MNISLWILADRLAKYNPEVSIQSGKRVLNTVRLYTGESAEDDSVLQVRHNADGTLECFHCGDVLRFPSADPAQLLNDIWQTFDFYRAWSGQLEKIVQQGGSLKDLLEASYPVIGQYIFLYDATYYIYEQYGDPSQILLSSTDKQVLQNSILPLDSVLEINRDQRMHTRHHASFLLRIPAHKRTASIRNLFFQMRHIGWLVLLNEDGVFTNGTRDLQDELGDWLERWMALHPNSHETYDKSSVFYQIFKDPSADRTLIYQRLRSMGWQETDKKQLYVFRDQAAAIHLALDRQAEQLSPAVFSVRHEDACCLVINRTQINFQQFDADFRNLLQKTGSTVGCSPVFTDIFSLHANYWAANIAARYSPDADRQIIEFQDSVLPYCLSLIQTHAVANMEHPAVSLLQEYDATHATNFLQTLETFLRLERSYSATAQALFIHRSTLLYRLDRILQLTNLDLDVPNTRIHLLLSFGMRRLSENRPLGTPPAPRGAEAR